MVCQESSETAPSLELLEFDSPESSFRELDDAFLQTQTRIWLGQVLQIRLDEQPIISELLADGELLFHVSKLVWKLLLAKHMELRHTRAFKSQPFASKKNGWRYRPYSNVDSFLKICKIVGLTGIDLFSPSDVVEKRNTRRVCMCIRSFSKNSRSMNINVPDFDIVTCMVTMPKDVVRCIRRNIELSHSILADSSGYYLQKHPRGKSRQGYSVTRSTREYEAYSNQSDDTEIKHSVLQCGDLYECDYTSDLNYNMMSPMVESVFISEDLDQLDIQNQQRNEVSNDEFELLCPGESLQYHCSENIDLGYKLTWSSSHSCGDLHIDFSDMTSDLDTRAEQVEESRIVDLDYFEHDLLRGNESFNLHNDRNDHWNKVKEEYESQDIMKCKETAYGITSYARYKYFVKEFEETEHSFCSPDCYFWKTNSSHRAVSHSIATSSTQLKKFLAYEDMKAQVDLKSLDNASCDQSDEELLSSQSYSLPEFCKWDQKGKCAMTSSRAKDNKNSAFILEGGSREETTPCKQNASEVLMSKVMLSCVPNKDVVSAAVVKYGKELKNDCPALASNALGVDDSEKCPTNGVGPNDFGGRGVTTEDIGVRGQRQRVLPHVITNDVVVHTGCDEDVSHNVSCLTNQSSKLECNSHQQCQYNMDPVYLSEHTREVHIQEETKPEDECELSFENLVETEEGSIEIPKGKPQKKLLLKSVLGGTAAVGLLFMFLHLRRNSGEKDAHPRKAYHKGKEKIQKYSPRKVKRSATRGAYPAEKLKIK